MATEDAERSPPSSDDVAGSTASDTPVSAGRYSWHAFLTEHGHTDAAAELYTDIDDEPIVPASAVDAHFKEGVDRTIRSADVDEPFVSDGDTAVSGHGTPEAGTTVIGTNHVVLSGSAVVPDGTSTAAPPSSSENDPDVDSGAKTNTDAGVETEVDAGVETAETATTDQTEESEESEESEENDNATSSAVDDTSTAPELSDGEAEDAERPGIEIDSTGVPGAVVVAATAVETAPRRVPTAEEWRRVDVDPSRFLGFDPEETSLRVGAAAAVGDVLWDLCSARYNLYEVPVLKGYYTWDDYAEEYFLDEEGDPPTDEEGEPLEFTHTDKMDALGFDPDRTDALLGAGGAAAADLAELVDERTVDVNPEVDEDAFFSTDEGHTTLANRYDLEKAVPMQKKTHFREIERYWVNKPYAFITVFRSRKENEVKYYAIQPHRTEIETDLVEFLTGKLRTSIKYADESIAGGDEAFRKGVIVDETLTLLDRYELYERDESDHGIADALVDRFGIDLTQGIAGRIAESLGYEPPTKSSSTPKQILARPEPAVLAENAETLSKHQVEKLLYYLKRDFIGYERIDPIKYDINVEDISCDGYNSPVFVYHSDYEQVITNIYHGTDELDDFVVKLAQRSGKGISKRRPQVDATLPDGSRAQLTLGREVSDHGTNYTIRQFNDVPFTPIDLINWKTFSLDEMAFLWLSIENHKSLIFAGGTASGKTTSLNAVSLFIPSNAKIVSIEDTREVELPQRNWIASVTRPSFSDDDKGDIDEFDLLEAALRQRPDYIVMGEIRGEEGRTAFQVMSTGHTTYTTFHADSVGEVLKRFTTDPINVSKTMFTALDLVSVQTSTRVQGKKVRRNKSLTEINHYDAENDEINVQDVFQWQAETDEFLQMGDSNTLEDIMFDRGWDRNTLNDELQKRRVVLAYLIDRGLNSYAQVAATFQAFINDPETILALMANDELERSLEDLREMESVLINVDRDKEEMVPRPDPDEAGRKEVAAILEEAEELFAEYRGRMPDSVADALLDIEPVTDVEARPNSDRETLTEAARQAAALEAEMTGEAPVEAATVEAVTDETPVGDDAERSPGVPQPTDHDAFEGVADATARADSTETSRDEERSDTETDVSDADTESETDVIDFSEPFGEGVDVLDTTNDPGGTNGSTVPGGETEDDSADANSAGVTSNGEGGSGDDTVSDDDSESESDDEIDAWGFGAVESPEER